MGFFKRKARPKIEEVDPFGWLSPLERDQKLAVDLVTAMLQNPNIQWKQSHQRPRSSRYSATILITDNVEISYIGGTPGHYPSNLKIVVAGEKLIVPYDCDTEIKRVIHSRGESIVHAAEAELLNRQLQVLNQMAEKELQDG